MSTLKVNNLQVGQSATATNNFTLYQPTVPDGTVRLGYGNVGSVTDSLTFTNTGRLGIGTTNPSAKFHVLDTTGSLSSTKEATAQFFRTDGTSNPRLIIRHSTLGTDLYHTYSAGATTLTFSCGNVENILSIVDGNGGRVGIGNTNPANKLHVSITTPATVPTAGTSGHSMGIGDIGFGAAIGALNNGKSYIQGTRWDGTALNYDLLLQPNGGNVGIGTTNPGAKLDVQITSTATVNGTVLNSYPIAKFINLSSDIGARGLEIGAPTGSVTSPVYLKVSGTGSRFSILNQSDSEQLTILDSGNVGIGTSNPTNNKLCVNGGLSLASNAGFNEYSGYSARSYYTQYQPSGATINICQILSNTALYNMAGPAVRLIARYTYYQGATNNNFLEVVICPRYNAAPAINTITTIGTVPTVNVSQSGNYATISVTYASDVHVSIFCEVYAQPSAWYI